MTATLLTFGPGIAQATQVVYNYTGQAFNLFSVSVPSSYSAYQFTSANAVSGSLAFSSPLAAGAETRGGLVAWSFSDGVHILNDASGALVNWFVRTDGAGAIAQWDFVVCSSPGCTVGSLGSTSLLIRSKSDGGSLPMDIAEFDVCTGSSVAGCNLLNSNVGRVFGSPGQWVATPMPEPQEWMMLAAGVGVVGWIARRRRRAEPLLG